ncbi:MAG TPA: pyridoxamine 5'-phosphate oxidase family protein [Burkholderiaceae bacterium]|nr:pyridoxamine 5'-phosphate oxidase family protein [Burkholderiaceae bacterium]
MTRDPFHAGELEVQQRAGQRALAASNGAMVEDHLTPGACRFAAQQRLVAVAARDASGWPRAALWLGAPGFLRCADERTFAVALPRLCAQDPVRAGLAAGASLGLLLVDLRTRRRLRVNGSVARVDDVELTLAVREAFANCPKYVQRREPDARAPAPGGSAATVAGTVLDAERTARIARADTVFVASGHKARGLDASHRGGEAGFVRVLDPRTLRFPDYPGNGMFQTLGNLAVDPRAGVAVVDFDHGRVLSLTGTVRTRFDEAEDPAWPTGGTGRYWELDVRDWLEHPLPSAPGWRLVEPSPFNPRSWSQSGGAREGRV